MRIILYTFIYLFTKNSIKLLKNICRSDIYFFRWELIAGRIPGRTPQEIERFWFIRNTDSFKAKRMQQKRK